MREFALERYDNRGGRYLGDLHENLEDRFALAVGNLLGDELEDAHPEGVDVDFLVVDAAGEDFRRHELGSARDGHLGVDPARGETQVADEDCRGFAVDEDVRTLQIAVDDGRIAGVQVVQRFEDLKRPPLDHLHAELFAAHVARELRDMAQTGLLV